MSPASSAYKRLCALYRNALCRMRALNDMAARGIRPYHQRVGLVEPLEPRLLLSDPPVGQLGADAAALTAAPPQIQDVRLTGKTDNDRDGYSSEFTLEVDVTSYTQESVGVEVWADGLYQDRLLEALFACPVGGDPARPDTISVHVAGHGLARDQYNLIVKLRARGTEVDLWYPGYDPDLQGVALETADQDRNRWTIMVYMMGADSDLSPCVDQDINLMESVALDGATVVVQADYGGNTGVRRACVVHDSDMNMVTSPSTWLSELDMGTVSSVRGFLEWAKGYTADNYALFLWGHSGVFRVRPKTVKGPGPGGSK